MVKPVSSFKIRLSGGRKAVVGLLSHVHMPTVAQTSTTSTTEICLALRLRAPLFILKKNSNK